MHLRDYLSIVYKQRWLILACLIATVSLTAISTFRARPVYQALARVEIDEENQYRLPFDSPGSESLYRDMTSYIGTRAKVMQSDALALRTIRDLELETHPEFLAGRPPPSKPVLASRAPESPPVRPAILDAFLGRLHITPVRNSRLLEIAFESHDPALGARIVNRHLDNFIEHNFQTRYEASVKASNWLSGQLDELKINVEKSEDALVAYERENQILTIGEKDNITTQKLAALNQELTAAETMRMQKASTAKLTQSGSVDSIPAVRDNSMLQNLSARHADLSDQHTEALTRFGPNYPAVLRLEARLEELEKLIVREKSSIVKRIETEYQEAIGREALLHQAVEDQKLKANDLSQKLVQYNILKREADANKQLYDGLLQRIKEARISAGLRTSNIRIVDPALTPSKPIRPRKARNLLLALLAGLLGGVGLGFLREYFDNTVKTTSDIECLTGLPSLTIVPRIGSRALPAGNALWPKFLQSHPPTGNGETSILISPENPRTQIFEVFRSLRTRILLSQAMRPPQVILVTSPLPSEGKSLSSVNLAITLAQFGDPTLLLEGDLRKPSHDKMFGRKGGSHPGLTSFLTGALPLEATIQPHPAIPNLSTLSAGLVPPNPAELLSCQALSDAINQLRSQYKFIVIDSPPMLSVTDATLLSSLADCVLLVARSAITPRAALAKTYDILQSVNSKVLGVVLNATDKSSGEAYAYYDYSPYYGNSAQDLDQHPEP